MKTLIPALVALALSASSAMAQARLPTVLDETGRPAPTTGVVLVGPDGGLLSTLAPIGVALTDRTVVSQSANQVAGTDPVLAANAARHVLTFVPAVDCRIWVAGGVSYGIPIYAGIRTTLAGPEAGAGAWYATGCGAAGSTLMILEG